VSASKTTTTILAIIALLATFGVGMLAGIAADRALILRGGHRRTPHSAAFMMKRLDKTLDLTPQQEREVEAILRRGHDRVTGVWGSVRPRLRQEVEQTNAEIARVLTPEQRAKFEKIKMRMSPRRRR
jgi:Spy/CpxP family protein refolding chaperone